MSRFAWLVAVGLLAAILLLTEARLSRNEPHCGFTPPGRFWCGPFR
jgi:hypothetical protein